MLELLTLKSLKDKALALNITGRVMPSNEEMVAYQEMVWERILSLCTPLNLAIPYNNGGIARPLLEEDCVQWYVKSPVIAHNDDDYIDIDSRLKEAFVHFFIAFLSLQNRENNRAEFESRGEMVCVSYECDVVNMGLPKAKQMYEQYNGISGVSFDCQMAEYKVDPVLIDDVIGCLVCDARCMNVAMFKQIERYKEYLRYMGEVNSGVNDARISVLPSEFEALRALDIAVFFYVVEHMELVSKYGFEIINKATTLGCELAKIISGESVADWVEALDKSMGAKVGGVYGSSR